MRKLSRRSAMRAAAGAVAGGAVLGGTAAGEEKSKLWALEGELKVHPKFLYRYYLVFSGQICALYGADHGYTPDVLARLQLPARVRVRGTLGTAYHHGGTKDNPSPFPATWTLVMDVHEVEALK